VTSTWERFYPELVRAGSLAAALDVELAKIGSSLRSAGTLVGVDAPSFASVTSGGRSGQVLIGLEERAFILSVWESEIEMADGSSPELTDVAGAIRLVLESGDRKVSDLVREIPFLELEDFALSHERGTFVEDKWQVFLARSFDDVSANDFLHRDELPELIRLAAERPELRRLLPFTSLHRFSVSPTPIPNNGIPVIWPLGNGRYILTPYWGGERSAEGSAAVVLDALVEVVRSWRWDPAGS
jgi:hypothetical protein